MDLISYALSKKYTKESLLGGGAVVGKNVTVSSITPIDGGNKVTFSYTLDDGTVKTSAMDVMDGNGVVKVEKIKTVDLVDTYRMTFDDGSTFDYEVTNGDTIVVPDLRMEVKATPNNGYLKTYQFTYGTGTTFEVDIPKDLIVESGEVITVTDDAPVSGLTNGTYLKLVIVNQTEPVYINTSDLCDVYTGRTATDGVSVSVSDTNEISATLVGKAVTEANLDDALAQKIADAEESFTWGTIA